MTPVGMDPKPWQGYPALWCERHRMLSFYGGACPTCRELSKTRLEGDAYVMNDEQALTADRAAAAERLLAAMGFK